MRSILQFLAGTVLVVGTYWNLWNFTLTVGRLPSRESDPMVVWENKFFRVQDALIRENYRGGNIAYETARSLRREPRTENDELHWAQLRYVTIPLILVRDAPDTPYVIGDFTQGDPIPEVPDGLSQLYDAGNGLILYKRKPAQ